MIIQKIEIENFRSYYKQNIFELTNGPNLIIGSNGDGKSRRIKDVILKPQFGFLKINHSKDLAGAEVYVSNRLRGTLPLDKPIAIKSGVSEIRIVKNLYHDYNTSVTISDDQTSTINADLKPNFAEVTINADGNSEIWIDDQLVGTGKWTGRLEIRWAGMNW